MPYFLPNPFTYLFGSRAKNDVPVSSPSEATSIVSTVATPSSSCSASSSEGSPIRPLEITKKRIDRSKKSSSSSRGRKNQARITRTRWTQEQKVWLSQKVESISDIPNCKALALQMEAEGIVRGGSEKGWKRTPEAIRVCLRQGGLKGFKEVNLEEMEVDQKEEVDDDEEEEKKRNLEDDDEYQSTTKLGSSKGWTEAEDYHLYKQFINNVPIREISISIEREGTARGLDWKRSASSIEGRIKRLGGRKLFRKNMALRYEGVKEEEVDELE